MAKRRTDLRMFHPSNDDPNAIAAVSLGALEIAAELSSTYMSRLNAFEKGTAVGNPEWAGPMMSGVARLEILSDFVDMHELDECTGQDSAEKRKAVIDLLTVVSQELWRETQRLLYEALIYLQQTGASTIVVDASSALPDALLTAINACAEEILFDEPIFDEESRKRFTAIAAVAALPRLTVPLGKFENQDVLQIPIQTDLLVIDAFQQAKRVLLFDNYVRRIRFKSRA